MAETTPETTQSSSPRKGMNPIIYGVIAVFIVLIIGGGYYLSKKAASPTQSTTNSAPMQAAPTSTNQAAETATVTQAASSGSATTTNEQDITVTGSNFKFVPSTITIKKGQKVKIIFTNSGGMHDFVLDGYNVKTDIIPSGQSQTVEFTADKAGTFDYYCSVGNHRAMGMQGTLTVQ